MISKKLDKQKQVKKPYDIVMCPHKLLQNSPCTHIDMLMKSYKGAFRQYTVVLYLYKAY